MVLSVVLVLFLAPFLSGKQLRILAPGIRSPRFMITLAVGALLVALNWQAILQKKDEFITKGVDVAGVAEAYQLSRGPLIEEMLANIRERPFTGIGFGIASQPQAGHEARPTVDRSFGIWRSLANGQRGAKLSIPVYANARAAE